MDKSISSRPYIEKRIMDFPACTVAFPSIAYLEIGNTCTSDVVFLLPCSPVM